MAGGGSWNQHSQANPYQGISQSLLCDATSRTLRVSKESESIQQIALSVHTSLPTQQYLTNHTRIGHHGCRGVSARTAIVRPVQQKMVLRATHSSCEVLRLQVGCPDALLCRSCCSSTHLQSIADRFKMTLLSLYVLSSQSSSIATPTYSSARALA